ncbi:MAG: hypothetical protein Q7J04_07085 [Microcella sp.]|nr:hypothetical protein [Microcella sp.]
MTQITTENPSLTTTPLTALDRCDSCGAQAYVRVTLATGELLFCGHHAARFRENITGSALAWHDETDRLTASA